MIGRRSALLGLTAAFSFGRASLALASVASDRRLVVVILRGALDGLDAVVPYGDRNLTRLRPALIPGAVGSAGGMLDLGGFYGLHPALAGLHGLYTSGEMLVVHAVAGPYRVRSHFEAQDLMECGADHRMDSGWLNRVVAELGPAARSEAAGSAALSVGLSLPLLLRGTEPVGSWAPWAGPLPPDALYDQILALNASDPVVSAAMAAGRRARAFASAILPVSERPDESFATLAQACGKLLAAPGGPRIAALELGGWDTHAFQSQRLPAVLSELGGGLQALQTGLGAAWAQTAVLVMTEFGRTVRQNGTAGTDHGTGTVALVLGGGVKGGRVAGIWPGLARRNLLEDRDLYPTTDLRSIGKAVLEAQFGLTPPALARIFPGSGAAQPLRGVM